MRNLILTEMMVHHKTGVVINTILCTWLQIKKEGRKDRRKEEAECGGQIMGTWLLGSGFPTTEPFSPLWTPPSEDK